MKAYHFLRTNMTASAGNEPPWQIGEERSCEGAIRLCQNGYHSSQSWYDALSYAPGPIASIVEVSTPEGGDAIKQVSRTRHLVAAIDVERELRLWACECAERTLLREREHGNEPDPRCWNAVAVARRYAEGLAEEHELRLARESRAPAWEAAWAASRATTSPAAWAAATVAARSAAWGAIKHARGDIARADAWKGEVKWQRRRLDVVLRAVFAGEQLQGTREEPNGLAVAVAGGARARSFGPLLRPEWRRVWTEMQRAASAARRVGR